MTNHRGRACVLTCALLACPALAAAQAVTNPNQIAGVVELATANPAIRDFLRDPPGDGGGIEYRSPSDARADGSTVRAASLGTVPSLSHVTVPYCNRPGRRSADYDLTVESSATGIAYSVGAFLQLHGGFYQLRPVVSPPVLPDPAPDTPLDLIECVGMLNIRYLWDTGAPVIASSAHVEATIPSPYELQATGGCAAGPVAARVIVRGGNDFHVFIRAWIATGTDPEVDLIYRPIDCERDVHASCDEIVDVTCVFPTGSGSGGSAEPLGAIAGTLDVIGEHEHYLGGRGPAASSSVLADAGPWDNRRWRVLTDDPASGDFLLPNLLPSEVPGWKVAARACFGHGYDFECLEAPILGRGSNPRVPVRSGATTDLGSTFVIAPGLVDGDIQLSGPRSFSGRPLLGDLRRDLDDDGDGVPSSPSLGFSRVEAVGVDVVAPGASRSAAGAAAAVGFSGALDGRERNWLGSYRLRLGGLDSAASVWRPDALALLFRDASGAADSRYQDAGVGIVDLAIPDAAIVPGSTTTLDRRYCFSEVELAYESTSGVFTEPRYRASGTFVGRDFLGRDANQRLEARVSGLPPEGAVPRPTGSAWASLPQGSYTLDPFVTSMSPSGRESLTELPPIDLVVGCRQVIRLTSDVVPQMDTLDECTRVPSQVVHGSVSSRNDIARLIWSLNGGAPVEVCAPCGASPSFAIDVAWSPCENELLVHAVDTVGHEASVIGTTIYDVEAPTAAAPQFTVWPPNHRYLCFANVAQGVQAVDDCPGPIAVRLVGCSSNQPDDVEGSEDSEAGGDGETRDDCVVAEDGSGFCLRAERLGGCPEGRTYSVLVRLEDSCGNASEVPVAFHVPHSWDPAQPGTPARPDTELPSHAVPKFPFAHVDDSGLPRPFVCP